MRANPGVFAATAIAAAAIAVGLFVSRTSAAFLYQWSAGIVDRPVAITIAAGVALLVVPGSRLFFRRGATSHFTAIFIPAIGLWAVFARPFPDQFWALLTLAAVALGMLVSGRALLERRPQHQQRVALSCIGLLVRSIHPHLAGMCAAAVSFAIYLRTMAPSVVEGDSAEFQTVGYTLGIAHPTGYPLYLLMAKAFTFLPFGDVAFRVNLLSGVCAALAVYFVVRCAQKISGDNTAGVVAGLTLAFTPVFWSQAVIAEVYALNALFIAVILYCLVTCGQRFREGGSSRVRWLWVTFGFGLVHHRTVILLAPVLAAYLLLYRRSRFDLLRSGAVAAQFALLPLALYAYLPIRWPAEFGQAIDWQRFQSHVLASGYQFALQADSLFTEPGRYLFVLDLLSTQLPIPALIVALAGLAALMRSQARSGLLLLVTLVVFALFPVVYHVPDVAVFSIPTILVLSILLGVGLGSISRAVNGFLHRVACDSAGFPAAIAALLPAYLLVIGLPVNDMSGEAGLDRWGKAALAQSIPPGALVVSDMPHNSALRYFYGVVAPERDLKTVMPDSESDAGKIISDTLASGHSVYLARFVPGLEKYRLDAAGPLVSVVQAGEHVPAGAGAIPLAPGIGLVDFTPGPAIIPAGEPWPLRLQWHNQMKLSDSYYVHVRLIDSRGETAFRAKPSVPVQGMYPTWAWPVRSVVNDYREHSFPVGLRPGSYQVEVGLGGAFRPPASWTSVGNVSISPPSRPPTMTPALVVFGDDIALTGFKVDAIAQPGGLLRSTLRWEKLDGEPRAPLRLELDLVGGNNVAGSSRIPLWSDVANGWSQPADLRLGKAVQPGTYHLVVRLTSEGDRPLPVREGWAGETRAETILAEVVVRSAPGQALTNLENKVILLRRDLEADRVAPGDALRLTLHWQAMSQIDFDYTVFVHLLDVNGKVRGQIDSYPLGGLRPTSQWRAGDVIVDPYQLKLPSDLAPGDYQIEVGIYLASTMQRLQVIDDEENPVDDRVLVGPVHVQESKAR